MIQKATQSFVLKVNHNIFSLNKVVRYQICTFYLFLTRLNFEKKSKESFRKSLTNKYLEKILRSRKCWKRSVESFISILFF